MADLIYSAITSLDGIDRNFDPDEVRNMKAHAERDITVGGPGLAAHAINGTHWLPDNVRVNLELRDERRSRNGVVYLRYRAKA